MTKSTTLLATRSLELKQEISRILIGQDAILETALIALFAGGHIILEGVPGLAKTLLARALASSLNLSFKRIQFTPDLMPSDIVGTNVFQPASGSFKFLPGPVFANVLLADEINRTPPKTQSALLEAMEERQVTVDGTTFPLPPHFYVIATQNPIEYEGTFTLPEAQTDRFLFKIRVSYPSPEEEKKLLQLGNPARMTDTIKPCVSAEDFTIIAKEIDQVMVSPAIFDYLIQLLTASRNHPQLALGASPRAGLAWLRTARVIAAIRGRDFVIPDDLKNLAHPLLRHRLIRKPETEIEGISVDQIINQLLASVPVPR
jgi:MoxR-like ATPase